MTTLLLARHAKSDWSEDGPDHERPLSPRGVRTAPLVAAHLTELGLRPELVLCSSARRARETLELLRPAFADGADVRIVDELYGAEAADILHQLRALKKNVPCVMVVGHNPAVEDLALDLAGDGNVTAMTQLRAKFPTCAVAVLRLGEGPWSEIAKRAGYLEHLVIPRDLKGQERP